MNLNDIPLSEVMKHNGKDGKMHWIIIDEKVYDVTGYDHPGGGEVWEEDNSSNNRDLFEGFMDANHSITAEKIMKKFLIGKIQLK